MSGYGGWQQGWDDGAHGYGGNHNSTFVLIVVLFILLIIVGTVFI